MNSKVDGPQDSKEAASTAGSRQRKGIEGLTLAELLAQWKGVVHALENDGVSVTNPAHAMEGALSIRCGTTRRQMCRR